MTDQAELKLRMKAGQGALGVWLELGSPTVAELLAEVGYDFAILDMEHGPHSVGECVSMMQAMRGTPCVPVVRVPWNDHAVIKRVLDAGARGIMVPSVNDAAEAEAVVAACRYPPRGRRGIAAGVARATRYGLQLDDYLRRFEEEELLVICQIETVQAVNNIESIAAVEGVDVLFIGPNDLAADAGYFNRMDAPEVEDLVARVEEACERAGRLLGGIANPGRSLAQLKQKGYRMMLQDADTALLRDAALASLARQRAD
ncbi:MAG TPA: aldolase/citrate lyase family protein [Kiloniellales bacterium]|nr:aldolase/citrate lyase family protein [Kiloniellales bacterium]